MNELLTWATKNPGLFIVLVIAAAAVGSTAVNAVYLIFKYLIRMVNVTTRGWPPYYLDADGDFRPQVGSGDND